MSLKMFILLATSFFASSAIILVLLKKLNPNFANLGSKTWWMNLGYGIIGSAVSFCTTLLSENNLVVFVLLACVSFLLGYVFYLVTHKLFFKKTSANFYQQVNTEFFYFFSVFSLLVAGFLAAKYFFGDAEMLLYPVIGALLFFMIPVLIYLSFIQLMHIPEPVYTYWEYPGQGAIPLPDEQEYDEILVVALKVQKSESSDSSYSLFRTKAPIDMLLGDLFFHFINEYNEAHSETPIVFESELHVPYKWYLHREKKGIASAKVLDPTKSIADNRLKEDDVIVFDRIASA